MVWKKALKWIVNGVSIILLVLFVEGKLLWMGLGAVLLMAAWRIWRQREAVKTTFQTAGMLGKMHKEMARKELDVPIPPDLEVIHPEKIEVVNDEFKEQKKGQTLSQAR